ncbi:MAG: hypothetical protein QOE70_4363 [Chthoniobacter sp.]|jgi:hypothetical protein|nr:hypothetical protein [Chthoniobacter sp.]
MITNLGPLLKPELQSYQNPGNPHLGTRRTTHLPPSAGASGGRGKQRENELSLAESQSQGNAIAKEKADARTYRRWFESLNEVDQAFARLHGLHRPPPADGRPQGGPADPDVDFCDPAELHAACIHDHPVDRLEPQHNAVEVQDLSPAAVRAASDTFGEALRWALDAVGLVELGKRSAVLIAGMRTDLAGGLHVDPDLARGFLSLFPAFRLSEAIEALRSTGDIYSRFLEWMRRATSISALGERLQLVAYELRPDLIDAGTLAELGRATNKTRQAKDKGVNCLRDTFAGLKALAMRPDVTRLRCQLAHLA